MPWSGNPAEFHGWASLFRSIMHEAGLGKVMSGTEKAPEAPADSAETAAAAFEKDNLAFKEKNGKLSTRLYLATSDCPDGFSSTASQVVQSFAPIWPEEFGDGRGAFLAPESKYRELGSLAVTADDKFDPAHAIQQLRRISTELDAVGDKVVPTFIHSLPTRKTHAFLKALPDKHCG